MADRMDAGRMMKPRKYISRNADRPVSHARAAEDRRFRTRGERMSDDSLRIVGRRYSCPFHDDRRQDDCLSGGCRSHASRPRETEAETAAHGAAFRIKSIDHTDFTVSSLDDSLKFWVGVLGFRHLYTWTFDRGPFIEQSVGVSGRRHAARDGRGARPHDRVA